MPRDAVRDNARDRSVIGESRGGSLASELLHAARRFSPSRFDEEHPLPRFHRNRSARSACIALSLCGLAVAAGCTSSRTFVLDPVATPRNHAVASLRQLPSTVEVSPALAARFEQELARKLALSPVDSRDTGDLTIAYRFVLFDSGSTAARVGAGIASLVGSPFYGLGDGALGVDVVFTDAGGRTVGHILVDGPISGVF